MEPLSQKELGIIRLIVVGESTVEIYQELGYSKQTVRNYLHEIYRKTGTNNRVGLAIIALERGWLNREIHRE